jgi:hypothetical protein
MKAIFISFNQAYYEAIMSIMDRNNIKGFTYWDTVQGRGSETGKPHYGSHAWPTLNSAILTIVEDRQAAVFLDILHTLDQQTEAQGLRAFVWTIEQTI